MAEERFVTFVDLLEEEARAQLLLVREWRLAGRPTGGDDKFRMKVAIGNVMSYIKFRGTLANERTSDLVEQRLLATAGARQLPEAGSSGA